MSALSCSVLKNDNYLRNRSREVSLILMPLVCSGAMCVSLPTIAFENESVLCQKIQEETYNYWQSQVHYGVVDVSITAKNKAFMNMILLAQKMIEKIMQKLQAELVALCQITINAILYFFSLLHFPAICV